MSLWLSACKVDIKFHIDFYVDGVLYETIGTDGKAISMPKPPNKPDFAFAGWYWDDSKWEKSFTINSLLDQPLTDDNHYSVYAKWAKANLAVKFEADNNISYEDKIFKYNSLLTGIPNPEKEHYTFAGWYKDSSLSYDWDFANDRIADDIVLYAKWTPVNCAINFDSNGGTKVDSISIPYGYTLSYGYPEPTKEGFYFGGWYDNAGFANNEITQYEFVDVHNVTLYAKWSEYPSAYRYEFNSELNGYMLSIYSNGLAGHYVRVYETMRIPSTYNGYPIVGIAENCFSRQSVRGHIIKEVVLPNSVVYIGSNAFRNLSYLSVINLHHVQYFGAAAFKNSGLKEIDLFSATTIQDEAFYYNSNLTKVYNLSTLATVANSAFAYCYDVDFL